MLELVDTHCHLNEHDFQNDMGDVLARAAAAGVTRMLCIGITADSSRRAVELAAAHPTIWAVVGIQPNYVSVAGPDDWQQICELARAPKVVGLGETGLDQYWDHSPLALQQDYFRRHLELSRELDLPFVVHCRQAEREVVDLLRETAAGQPWVGVMHSFTGDEGTAAACMELGLLVSFAGMLTYKKSEALREVARGIPPDRLLVETDSPYLIPSPLVRGKRNEPAHVVHTLRCLAGLHGLPEEELAAITTNNARRLFRLP
jgi:TatD DNase family protein